MKIRFSAYNFLWLVDDWPDFFDDFLFLNII